MTSGQLWCRVRVVRADGSTLGSWALRGDGTPDLGTVEWVARIRLAARWAGGQAVLEEVAPQLAELLELVGLADHLRG